MVKATRNPDGTTAYHLDAASEWKVDGVSGEIYLTHLHRQKHLEVQARLSGRALPDPHLVAAGITQALVASLEPAARAGRRFTQNPGGRPRNAEYAVIHDTVSGHRKDGMTLKAALYAANEALHFSEVNTPEALDKAWRRVVRGVTP